MSVILHNMKFVEFNATGHENVRAMHKTTFEFTKSSVLSLDGDCIVGVNADFDAEKLKEIIFTHDKIKITISAGFSSEIIEAIANKRFNDCEEIVVRMGEFDSSRTLGIRASKAAIHFSRDFIEKLKNPNQKIKVRIEGI